MGKQSTIKGKIIIQTVVYMILAILVCEIVSVCTIRNNMNRQTRSYVNMQAQTNASVVNEWLNEQANIVHTIRNSVAFSNSKDTEQIMNYLEQCLAANDNALMYYLCLAYDGGVFPADHSKLDLDPTTRDWWKQAIEKNGLIYTAPYKDMEIVVFEGMENKFGIEIATHMDLSDEDQTIEVPGGGTTAKDKATDDEVARNVKELEIVDTITYRNLEPGKEYTATGVLYKKSTKEPLKDANGNVIKNTVTFTPAAKNGTVDVTFKVDASLLGGETLVVFEDVLYKNETVFIHHDIEDSNQSTYIPKIGTTATAKNGDKSVSASKNVTIVDKVQYTNLVPGKEYKVSGILYDKSTGGKLVINGQNVTAEKTFTPEKADGYVEIEFTFDASSLSTSVVAFEYLYHKDVEVTTHTDITDEGQTVSITPPSKPGVPTPPKTGMMIFFIILGIMVSGGAGMLIFRKKKA